MIGTDGEKESGNSMQSVWFDDDWFGLVLFYGISTVVDYLMPNPVFAYVLNVWFVNTFCRYTQLNDQTVLFPTILLRVSQS